jgi:hypothetical protein
MDGYKTDERIALTQLEGKVEALLNAFNRLDREVNGNGQPGMAQKIDKIVAYVEYQEGMEEAMREVRKKAKDTRKLILWILGIAISGATTVTGWGVHHLWSVIEPPAAAIIEEYWAHHPQAVAPKNQPARPPVSENYTVQANKQEIAAQ